MKSLVWNCRGLGHSRSVRELAEMVRNHRPMLVGLQETKIDASRLEAVRKRLGFKHGFQVPRIGLAGGLALWWKEEVTLTILSYSKLHIDAMVEGEEIVRVTLIYGEPVTVKRGVTWELLRRLNSQHNLPWILFGDFNEVCFGWEVKGGRVRGEWQMRAFREAMTDCGLTDLGFEGSAFTFSNRRIGQKEIKARLDRMIANNEWRRIFPDAQVSHFSATSSDHSFLLLNCIRRERRRGNKGFCFEPMWVSKEGFAEVVSDAWRDSAAAGTSLTDSLSKCGRALDKWNNEKFGRVGKRIRNLKAELEAVRRLDRDSETIAKEADLVQEIDEWRLREEILWRQRSRAEWLREGDRNTSFFHAKASQRRKSNLISKLQNKEGSWITQEEQMGELIKEYFTDIFSSSKGPQQVDQDCTYSCVQQKVTTEMAGKLCEPVSEMEVQAAVFQMAPSKAPGPDGFHAMFYQKLWTLLRAKVTETIHRVFENGMMEEGMNDTLIVLILKSRHPKKVEDFRPISLCNVSAKIVMKILANRLKDILPLIISETQSAFVPGRLISENILLAHEVSHYIKSRRSQRTGFFSIKTDMSKAYDRMEWSFLSQMLNRLGFPDRCTRLILECISSVRYKVKLNDRVIDLPPPERGLRQGDPLFPYLFLLCSEWLSMKIEEEAAGRRLKGVRVCQGAPMITHLFFADDSTFFMKATEQNAVCLKEVLRMYEAISGQRINNAKSEVVFSRNVDTRSRQVIKDLFAVKEVERHTKYLGLPIVFSHNKVELFKYLIENMWKRIMGWKELQHSIAGKEILVKSVLQAMPIYAMMCFKLPVTICKRLAGIIKKFWWSGEKESRSIYWANQFKLCMPKNQGDLDFRDLTMFNDALLAKQYWRLLKYPESIICRTLKAKYFKHVDLLGSNLGPNCSLAWRGIWRAGYRVRRWLTWDQNRGCPV
ncbi:hypothetical protein QQ045_010411 [Rhodiola kirilowii]